MADENRKANPGALLAALGFLIFGAVIVAGYFGRRIPFFGENFFLPILMIFAGRAMSRRAKRKDTSGPQPIPQNRPRSATRQSPPPRSLSARTDPLTTPAPDMVVAPAPMPPPPALDEPEPRPMRRQPSPEPRRVDPVHYPTTGRVAKAPEMEPKRADPVHYPTTGRVSKGPESGVKPKSSAEMVAEAKKRLRSRD